MNIMQRNILFVVFLSWSMIFHSAMSEVEESQLSEKKLKQLAVKNELSLGEIKKVVNMAKKDLNKIKSKAKPKSKIQLIAKVDSIENKIVNVEKTINNSKLAKKPFSKKQLLDLNMKVVEVKRELRVLKRAIS